MIRVRRWVVLAGVVLALVAGVGAGWTVASKAKEGTRIPFLVASANTSAVPNDVSFATGFSSIVKSALPTVVNVSSDKVVRSTDNGLQPFFDDPFFRHFFGGQFNVPQERREHSLGSGVIVSPDGYILTNNHVIDGANAVKVSFADKREVKARVVGSDQKTDIAVLKVDGKNLPAIPLGDSSKVEVGEFSLAIGNPFGVGQTVTFGIISARGRNNLGIEDYEDFIQTDAAINPGNSGGALIDARGELIGINTAIISRGGGGNQGVGLAVPVNLARDVMEQILKTGKVVRGYLGVYIQEITPALAKAFNLSQPGGAIVSDVSAGSPASKAGLMKGDVITELNGERVTDSRTLRLKIAGMPPGTSVRLKLLRNGSERDVTITLGELPSDASASSGEHGSEGGTGLQGVSVQDLTPQIARQLDLPSGTRGVVVSDVKLDSAAADAGLQRGDVIQEVNHKTVSSVADYNRAIADAKKGTVLLVVNRHGNTLFIAIEPR